MEPREVFVRDTQRWLERAVIGLNLCPFAKAPHVKGLVHFAVSDAQDPQEVLADVAAELDALAAAGFPFPECFWKQGPICVFGGFRDG